MVKCLFLPFQNPSLKMEPPQHLPSGNSPSEVGIMAKSNVSNETRNLGAEVKKFKTSTFREALLILNPSARKRLKWMIFFQAALGIFDLAAVAVIGLLASLAVRGIQSAPTEGLLFEVITKTNLNSLSFQSQVALLGLIAAVLFISKTVLSVIFVKSSLAYLGKLGSETSSDAIARFFSQPLNKIVSENPQLNIFAVTSGIDAIMLGVIGASVTAIADVTLMIFMIIALSFVDFVLSFTLIVIFSTLGYGLFRKLRMKAFEVGQKGTELNVSSNQKIMDLIQTYRESFVSNTLANSISAIQSDRRALGIVMTEKAFMPNITKYFFEIVLVLGALSISAYQFLISDASAAVATLTVFLAAGSRIAPAALRLQHWALQLKTSLAAAKPTLFLLKSVRDITPVASGLTLPNYEHHGFISSIEIQDLHFSHSDNPNFKFSGLNLSINEGQFVAIVGPSGSGKSTLIDLMLGLLEPDKGSIKISGVAPSVAITKWPGAISYLPQEIQIISGSIRENVSRGFTGSTDVDREVNQALQAADLGDFILGLPAGIDSELGNAGSNVSGGQRQRLGIARVLFSHPRLLVMDEGTSALDGETEWNITQTLRDSRRKMTLVIIAHRLTTVMAADKIFYVEDGGIIACGTFDELRKAVPDFELQAKRMGL
jgi:ABC-type multidrug transport system fused ATPase/permease subunit